MGKEKKQTHIEKEELSKELFDRYILPFGCQRSGFNNSQTTSYVYRTEEVSKIYGWWWEPGFSHGKEERRKNPVELKLPPAAWIHHVEYWVGQKFIWVSIRRWQWNLKEPSGQSNIRAQKYGVCTCVCVCVHKVFQENWRLKSQEHFEEKSSETNYGVQDFPGGPLV